MSPQRLYEAWRYERESAGWPEWTMLEAASQQMWMRIHENYVGSTVRTLANKVVVTLPSGGTHHAPAIFGVPRVGDLATIDGESHTVMSVVWDYDGSVIRVTLGPP